MESSICNKSKLIHDLLSDARLRASALSQELHFPSFPIFEVLVFVEGMFSFSSHTRPV